MAAPTTVTPLDAAAQRDLERSFHGLLVRPRDAGYDEARRVWNASIDRSPAIVARCADADDVAAAVLCARRSGVPVAVRSGGHSFPGLSVCDDGVVVDLSSLRAVEVDPEARTVRVQAGVLLGELDRATQAHGLAVPAGIVTHTGVDLVTADGELVRASAEENEELFWGVRGGGGNFGVVTEFRFRAHPVGPILLSGPIFWPMERSPEVLRFYRDWIAEAPDELMTIVIHRKAPPLPFVPPELHGRLVVAIVCCYAGPVDEGERLIAPLRAFSAPVIDACVPKPFLDHQAMFDPSYPHGWWYYMRACDVAELTDDVIDTTVEHSLRIRSQRTAFPIWQRGGAASRVGADETAFGPRSGGYTFNITAATEGPEGFDAERDWVRSFWTALAPHHTSVYVNFLMEEGEERVREAYGAATYDRLKALKRRYDPENVFRLNQNISPG